ncbi:hypothetical protein BKA83DRAFT_4499435 [Pisolithus microcarpus]|nr:hypothetical protein BKA83DRAFT_4499435 [Pisolithus microcarpus]
MAGPSVPLEDSSARILVTFQYQCTVQCLTRYPTNPASDVSSAPQLLTLSLPTEHTERESMVNSLVQCAEWILGELYETIRDWESCMRLGEKFEVQPTSTTSVDAPAPAPEDVLKWVRDLGTGELRGTVQWRFNLGWAPRGEEFVLGDHVSMGTSPGSAPALELEIAPGWEYLEYLEDIFPQGGATGAHAFRAGASNPIPVASTDGSNASGTTPIPPPSVSDSIPVSVVSVGSLAITSNPITSDPPASNPPTSTSGGKRSFNTMSADVMDTAPPSLLFSNQCPPATSVTSAPKSKRSRTSSSKANPQGSSHTVAVISVDNTIRRLGDQLSTTFMDPLMAVRMATQSLYRDSEILPHHRAYMTHQFSANSNTAAVFISLPDDEARRAYAADMYTNSRLAPESSEAGNQFAL